MSLAGRVEKLEALVRVLNARLTTGGGGGGASAHSDLTGVTTSQHHVKYTDAEAVTAVTGEALHDGFSDFVADEHLDWTADQGATNIHANNYTDTNTQLTDEQVEDVAGPLVASGGTKTNITVTYQDATGDMDFEVDNFPVSGLADGTDGELITWDEAGAPATVEVGTATHVLTSNGEGAAPTFQAPAAAGSAVTIAGFYDNSSDVTTSSTTLVIFTGSSVTYTPSATETAHASMHAVTRNSGTNNNNVFEIQYDSARAMVVESSIPASNLQETQAGSIVKSGITAASHTWKLMWRTTANTASMLASTAPADFSCALSVMRAT